MNNDEIFSRALQGRGMLIAPQTLPPQASEGLIEQLELYRLIAPDVICGFVNNAAFNAVATVHDNREIIGIYLGSITMIARYAYGLFSDPDMFPQIGCPAHETVDPIMIRTLRQPSEHVVLDHYLPRDPIRVKAAQHIAMCAYLILFFHELSHLELCHLSLIAEEFGAPIYEEVNAAPISKEQALLIRALEWDADNAALEASLKMWRSMYSHLHYSSIASLGSAGSWFLAANLLFWVMDFIQPLSRRGLLATHPSPRARLTNARLLTTHFRLAPDLSESCSVEVDSLIGWIVRSEFPSNMVATANEEATVERAVNELIDARNCYKQVEPRLERYQDIRRQLRDIRRS